MINFALAEILKYSAVNGQRYDIMERVYASWRPLSVTESDVTTFEGAPPDLNIHHHITEVLTRALLSSNDRKDVSISQTAAIRHLNALKQIYHSMPAVLSGNTNDSDNTSPEVRALGVAISTLEIFANKQNQIPAAASFSLVIGVVTLFSSAAAASTTHPAARFLRRTLLDASVGPPYQLGMLLVAFSLAWGNTVLSSQSTDLNTTSSDSPLRAIEWVTSYARDVENILEDHRNRISGSMINMGIMVLLCNPDMHQSSVAEVEELYQAFVQLPSDEATLNFYSVLHDFDAHRLLMNTLTSRLLSVCMRRSTAAAEATATAHLKALANMYPIQLGVFSKSISGQLSGIGDRNEERTFLLEQAIALLARASQNSVLLDATTADSVFVGTAVLLSTVIADCSPATASHLVLRLLAGEQQYSHQWLGVLLLGFALSRSDPPGWTDPPLDSEGRVMRAIEIITYYAPQLDNLHAEQSAIMTNVGLLELLLNSVNYELSEQEFNTICRFFAPIHESSTNQPIHNLLPDFDIRSYVLEALARKLATVQGSTWVDVTGDETGARQDNPSVTLPFPGREATVDQLEDGPEQNLSLEQDASENVSDSPSRSRWRKWYITTLGGAMMLNVVLASSISTGIEAQLINQFSASTIVAVLPTR
ncbi:hypothetical protein RSOL_274270, partial [Rhizoctonia solani AG-3 Rhs1AP]